MAASAANGPLIQAPPGTGPLVAADVGAVYTKVYLLDDVEGERRLVAVGRVPTTGDDGQPAFGDALQRALEQALAHAGRPAETAPAERIVLTGTGAITRVALVVPRIADAAILAAELESAPVRLLEPLSLDGPAREPEHVLGQLEAQAPDAIVLVGGRAADQKTSLGAVEVIARGLGALAPPLVVVGEGGFAEAASALLAELPHLAADAGAAAPALDAVRELATSRLPLNRLRPGGTDQWLGNSPAASSLEGIRAATEIIAERYDVDVLTLDLGASHALAVAATGAGGRRRVVTIARDDVGSRLGRDIVLQEAGAEAIERWLPIARDAAVLWADARRGVLTPAALPETVDDLLVDHAFAREALRLLVAELPGAHGTAGDALPPIDLLIGSGGLLAGAPRVMQSVMILLDAVEPGALTQLALDRTTALPLIGHLGAIHGNDSIGAALERDGLLNLGLCIAPIGEAREGETAIKVEIVYTDRSPVTAEVPFGAIEVVPLPMGERASLKLWPGKDLDIGLGRGAAATPRAEVEGGAVGIIIDARGRPLDLPAAQAKRRAKLLQWLQATRAYPQLSFVRVQPGVESVGAEA